MLAGKITPRSAALISCDPASRTFVEEEMKPLLARPRSLEWLDDGLALANIEPGFNDFAAAVKKAAPVFVRHIAPVEREIGLTATEADIEMLIGAVAGISGRIDPALTFSVQSRILGEGKLPYRKVALNEALSRYLEGKTGAKMDARVPAQVVSVLCTPERGFLGVSRTEQNLSDWPGGMHRFKHEEGRISRSENKLLEALSVFHLALPAGGTALDMGASPGGWTHVLRERGLQVVAVDPAALDARLAGDAGVIHVRAQVQAYLAPGRKFAVVVNDMRMDASTSVEIMLQARSCLEQGDNARHFRAWDY